MTISKTRPNPLFASVALTEDGTSVSPRLFRNVAMRLGLPRGRTAGEPDSESALAICAFMRLFWPICTKRSNRPGRRRFLSEFDPGVGSDTPNHPASRAHLEP